MNHSEQLYHLAFRRLLWSAKSMVLQIVGVILIAYCFLPFPGGFLTLPLGMTLLVYRNLKVALFIQNLRKKHQGLDQSLQWLEEKVGPRFSAGLRLTRPESDPRAYVKRYGL